MSLGYENSEQTLSGVIDIYANNVDTGTLTVNGIDITGMVVGPTGGGKTSNITTLSSSLSDLENNGYYKV